MIVSGLNQNRYLTNNPIWVEITEASDKVILSFTSISSDANDQGYFFTFYTYEGSVKFDLAEIIKSMLPEPNHPQNPIAGSIIFGNNITTGLTFQSGSESQTINKTFFRGGVDSMATNLTLSAGAVLKESELIPVWQGYPSSKYTLNGNNQVIFSNILTNSEIDRMKSVVCNPVFLRFLNTKAGYSYWLFPEWELSKDAKTTQRIERRYNPLDLGLTTSHELSIVSRVDAKYNATLSALLQSPEVWIYNIESVLPEVSTSLFGASGWTRIYNNGGSMNWNAFEQVNEYSFSFDLLFKQNPQLKW